MSPIIALVLGFCLLILGGEILVRSAVRAAECLGVSTLMIGILLVGFGTSVPEMVISIYAAVQNSPGIAVGNVVGSSIANILLILGLAAIFSPIKITANSLSRDGFVVVSSAIAFSIISLVHFLDRFVGFLFVLWLVSYLVYAWRQETSRNEDQNYLSKEELHEQYRNLNCITRLKQNIQLYLPTIMAIIVSVIGLSILILGGKILVDGAVQLARIYNIKEDVIGLTIVAIGTSMPELVTSVVAALRKQPSVAVGNILGSNVYNVLGVGGITGLVVPTKVPENIAYQDNFIMVASVLALIFFLRSGLRVTRIEGSMMFSAYIIYVWWLLPSNLFVA
ncbi:MAG: Inner membrane protein YrbG [Hyphomicrobiaceae bacterium hypho_1]